MKRQSSQFLIATYSAFTALIQITCAATTWNGSSSGSWATPANWTSAIPTSADLITYGAGTGVGIAVANGVQTLDGSYAVLGFSVGNDSASPIVINNGTGSNTLTIGASGILLNSATGGSFTCNPNILMSAAQSFTTGTARSITVNNVANGGFLLTVNTAGSTSTTSINGVLSGVGGLTKSGPGTMTLSGTANSFSGQVSVTGGTLTIAKLEIAGNNSSIGTGNTASSIILNGGTINYVGTTTDTTDRVIDMRAGAAINNNGTGGQISFTAANVAQGGAASARTLTLGGSNANANTFGSILGDSGTGANISTLQKNGAGKWIVSGTQTYTGATIINQGTLAVGGSTVLGGASGSAVDAGNIVFGLNLNSGRLEFETTANLGAASQIRFRNTGGTAGLGGALVYVGATAQTVSKAIQCDTSVGVRLNSDSVGGNVDFSGSWAAVSTARPVYLGGTGTGDNTVSGSIIGSTLTKTDGGKWILSASNSYVGLTTISNGTLLTTKAAALPGYNAASRVSVANGATLAVRAGGVGEWSSSEIDSLLGSTTAGFTSGSRLGVDVAIGNSFTYANDIGTTQIAKSLVKSGAGNLELSGINTFTGGANITGGTLALSGSGSLADSTAVSLTTSGTVFDIAGITGPATEKIGSLSGSSGSMVHLGGNTLEFGDATNTSFSGVADGTGGGFKKVGSGIFTLNGTTTNTYTGTTSLVGGTLLLGNHDVLPNAAPFSLSGGTTFSTGGFNETTGSFSLGGNAVIDLVGGTSVLTFSNIDSWSGVLSVWNWNGTPNTPGGPGNTRLIFSAGSLTSEQLSNVHFYSGGNGSQEVGNGGIFIGNELVAVPEPTSLSACGMLVAWMLCGGRRRTKVQAHSAI